jgi:hypothetical protein
MIQSSPIDGEPPALRQVRRILLGTLAVGAAGTGIELVLLDHYEGWQQITPVALLGASVLISAWHALRPGAASVRTLQALMLLSVASGALGVVFHYEGNVEFELEMYPSMAGLELFGKTMTGATPVLAPGTMVVLGLVGLAHTYRHPAIARPAPGSRED